MTKARTAHINRKTKETDISIKLNLDGCGNSVVNTGIAFFDHMLILFAKQALFDIEVKAKGDIAVDYHHTMEDVGICIGQTIDKALGNRERIHRYGSAAVPMDEVLVRVSLDISGRPFFILKKNDQDIYASKKQNVFRRKTDVQLTEEFLKGLVNHAKLTLHVDLVRSGEVHHVNEAIYKAVGLALRDAVARSIRARGVSSTKGMI